MQEKRAFERIAVDIRTLFRGGNGGNLRGHVSDISMGGMFIETAALQRIGSYILADLDVDSLGKVVWAQGRVVRVTDAGGSTGHVVQRPSAARPAASRKVGPPKRPGPASAPA